MAVVLQQRDLAALNLLSRFRIADATRLAKYVYGHKNVRRTRERLQELRRAGFVLADQAGGRLIYRVSSRGLEEAGILLGRVDPVPPGQVQHLLIVLDVAWALTGVGLEHWITERELRHEAWRRSGRLAPVGRPPDGVLTGNGSRVAVEVQLTPKPAAYFEKVMKKYQNTDYDKVLWVVDTKRLGDKILSVAEKVCRAPASDDLFQRAGVKTKVVPWQVMLLREVLK